REREGRRNDGSKERAGPDVIPGASTHKPTRYGRWAFFVHCSACSITGRPASDGPLSTLPSTSKREPWQGQSQVFSAEFQVTTQPRCVQIAETLCRVPSSSRYAATLL